MTTGTAPRGRIKVRPAEPGDAARVADVYLTAFHATYDFALAHSDDQVRQWIRDLLIPAGDTWVATLDGEVVGMAVIRPGELDQLYVAPAAQGRGIGSRLVDLAKRRSPQGLGLYTFQANQRAHGFYERRGFVADAFGDGSGNEEREPDVHYAWTPGPGRAAAAFRPDYPIRTERLLLRPYLESDLEAVLDLNSRPDVVRYLPWGVLDRDGAVARVQRCLGETAIDETTSRIVLAATIPPDNRVIGEFMLKRHSAEHRQGEIGWLLHPDVHGRGYATEAARELLRLAFGELGLHRIIAEADSANGPSVAVMRRLGMRHEADLREDHWSEGEWGDSTVYSILEGEWRATFS